MIEKPFELGIIVGRFQTLHLGHESIIDQAIKLCDRVCVLIGSAQESGTEMNPYPYDERKKLLKNIYGDRIDVHGIDDMEAGNDRNWGAFVLAKVKGLYDRYPDLIISGKESRRTDWFTGIEHLDMREMYVPKSIHISGTQMRNLLLADDETTWRQFVNPVNWGEYGTLKNYCVKALGVKNTKSI